MDPGLTTIVEYTVDPEVAGVNSSGQSRRSKCTQVCAVCEDVASGKHYGTFSCEGCKGFFKRSVRNKVKLSCKYNQKCDVDKKVRNRCQFCRYSKCLNAGMNPFLVKEPVAKSQKDASNSRTKLSEEQLQNVITQVLIKPVTNDHFPLPLTPNDSPVSVAVVNTPSPPECGSSSSSMKPNSHDYYDPFPSGPWELCNSPDCFYANNRVSMHSHSNIALLIADIFRNIDEKECHPESLRDLTVKKIVRLEGKIAVQRTHCMPQEQMTDMLRWLSDIPYFKLLTLETQMLLMLSSWNEILILNYLYRSIKEFRNRNYVIVISEEVGMDSESAEAEGLEDLFQEMLWNIKKLSDFQIDGTEFLILKLLTFFNPYPIREKEKKVVEIIQSKIQDVYDRYTDSIHRRDDLRMSRILLRMADFRTLRHKCEQNPNASRIFHLPALHINLDELHSKLKWLRLNPKLR